MRRVLFAAWMFVAPGIVAAGIVAASIVAGFGVALRPASAWAQAEALDRAAWIGAKVMPKLNAEVKAENAVIDEKKLSYPLVVQDVKGDSLYVGDHDKGWVKRSGVVKLDETPAYYTSLIDAGEKLAWAYDRRATAWALLGKLDLAIADFGEELRIEPSARGYRHRGTAWLMKNQYDKAMDDCNEAVRLDPNDAAGYGNRALVWLETKEYDKAIDDLNQAIRLDPTDASAYSNRGGAWEYKKEHGKAIDDFNHAIHLDPNDAAAYISRGWAWKQMKDYDKAMDDFNQAIHFDPNNAMAHNIRGVMLCRKQDYDKAFADFDRSIQLDPTDESAHMTRGVLWIWKKGYDQAIEDFNQSLQLEPNEADAYFYRGKAWALKKEYEKAIADYNTALGIEPDHWGVYQAGAWLRATCPDARYRNGKRAVELATKVCEAGGWACYTSLDTLAAAYAESGDFDSAIKWEQKAIDLRPDDAKFVKEAKERLDLYRQQKPYRDTGEAPDDENVIESNHKCSLRSLPGVSFVCQWLCQCELVVAFGVGKETA